MGDTGSLFLGGVIGLTAICVKQELLLLIAGGFLSRKPSLSWRKSTLSDP